MISFVSSSASRTCSEDCAIAIIEVDACKRSRYRSLCFRNGVTTSQSQSKEIHAPNHQPQFLLLSISIASVTRNESLSEAINLCDGTHLSRRCMLLTSETECFVKSSSASLSIVAFSLGSGSLSALSEVERGGNRGCPLARETKLGDPKTDRGWRDGP